MVRTVHRAVMPMCGGTIKTLTRKHISGKGMGSVLLDGGLGTGGVGSSYSSLEAYIDATGANPYAGQPKGLGIKSLESMNKKIESLLVKSKKHNPKKETNIHFSI